MLQKSPYYPPIMLRAIPLCPKHASTILQLNFPSRVFYCINECSIGVFTYGVTALLEYIDFPLISSSKTGLLL